MAEPALKTPLKAGFIGLGEMGLPMVRHLSQAAIPTIVCDLNPAATAAAKQYSHITIAPSVSAVAQDCKVLFTCLPTLESVRDVYLGEAGIATSAPKGLMTCDCSTVTPDLAAELQAAMDAQDILHRETPVFGSPKHAQNGDLYFLISGQGPLPKLEPYIQAMGRGHRFAGAVGNASRIKLIQNALGLINAVATAEILALCKRTGIDLPTFIAVVKECDGIGNSTYFSRHAENVANGEDSGTGRLLIAAKDMKLIGAMAQAANVDAPLMKHTEQAYTAAHDAGLDTAEYTEVARILETRLGERLFYPA